MNMKRWKLAALAIMLTAGLHAQDFESAKDAVKNMGPGWNLGNTLDANGGTGLQPTEDGYWGQQNVTSETYWGQPVTTPELITMMKKAGFGAIRVPVTWYNHMDKNGKVDAAWMARVKEVVDYVIDAGMYCILNVHHDTGADGSPFISWLKASTNNYNQNKEKFEGLWTQIAETFKDYPQTLLFEGYNEMLDENNSWNFPTSSSYNEDSAKDSYEAINKYAQSFVNAVRATGGNNSQRNLVINTYGASNGSGNWSEHLKEPLTKMKRPSDEVSGHLAFEIHAYPALDGGKASIDDIFKLAKNFLAALSAPVILGEWGTSNVDASETDYDKSRSAYLDFAKHVITQAKAENIATFYWMGLTDGSDRTIPAFGQADLVETMAKAYHGSSFQGEYPSVDDFKKEYTVTYSSAWAELFLYGDWSTSTQEKLSDYKGIRVEMDGDYSDKLQVKIYGDKDGKNDDGSDKYKEQYTPLTAGGNTSTINFDASALGTGFYRITLQNNTTDTDVKATVKDAVLIKADGTEVPGTITVGWGCTVETKATAIPTGLQNITYRQENNSGAIYNLKGQRVTAPAKGIYIQNGKKYVAK